MSPGACLARIAWSWSWEVGFRRGRELSLALNPVLSWANSMSSGQDFRSGVVGLPLGCRAGPQSHAAGGVMPWYVGGYSCTTGVATVNRAAAGRARTPPGARAASLKAHRTSTASAAQRRRSPAACSGDGRTGRGWCGRGAAAGWRRSRRLEPSDRQKVVDVAPVCHARRRPPP